MFSRFFGAADSPLKGTAPKQGKKTEKRAPSRLFL